ncbi:hypothetical protein cyc_01245 [Cyclospora cayetanensis]|uniref:Uncharacterized protein n=1 Tax=Cyclospora cayetanensis TaxID=88456 RepID=A0A1D3D1W7_9EIME|nr:hypothetical protein cyc_01245 [Cyclospora cayetanensis]
MQLQEQNSRKRIQPQKQNSRKRIQPQKQNSHKRIQPQEQNSHKSVQPQEQNSHKSVQPQKQNSHKRIQPQEQNSHKRVQPQEQNSHKRVQPQEQTSHKRVQPQEQNSHKRVQPQKHEEVSSRRSPSGRPSVEHEGDRHVSRRQPIRQAPCSSESQSSSRRCSIEWHSSRERGALWGTSEASLRTGSSRGKFSQLPWSRRSNERRGISDTHCPSSLLVQQQLPAGGGGKSERAPSASRQSVGRGSLGGSHFRDDSDWEPSRTSKARPGANKCRSFERRGSSPGVSAEKAGWESLADPSRRSPRTRAASRQRLSNEQQTAQQKEQQKGDCSGRGTSRSDSQDRKNPGRFPGASQLHEDAQAINREDTEAQGPTLEAQHRLQQHQWSAGAAVGEAEQLAIRREDAATFANNALEHGEAGEALFWQQNRGLGAASVTDVQQQQQLQKQQQLPRMQEQGCSASQHEEPRSSAAPHSSAGEAPAAAAGPALEHSGLFPGSQGAPTPPAVLCCFHRLHKASSDASSDVSAAALGAETSLAAERREEAPERWRDSHSTQNDFIKQMLHSTSIRGQLALDCLGESDLPWEEDEDVADPSSTAAASTPAGDADPLQDILRLCKPLQPGMEPSVPSVYSDAVGDTDRSLTSAAAGESPPPAAAATTSAATAGTTSPASSGSAVTQALFSAAASACMQLLAASPAVATAATAVPASAATATSSSTAAARGAPPPSARKGVGSGGAKDAPAGVAEVRSTRFIPAEGTPLEVSRVLGRGAEESAAVRTSASGESRLITGDTGVAGVFVASHAFELGGVSGAVGCLQVHPTEATVAVAGTTSGETFLLDLEGLRIRSALPHCSRSSRGNPGNNRRACSSVAWVEAQGLIAVGSCEGRIALLDPRVGKEVSSWHAQKGPIDSFRAVGPYACVSASSKEAFLNFWDIRVPPQDPLQPFSSCDSQDWWCGGGMGARRGVLSCMRFEDGISDVAVSPEESCFAVATLGGDVTLMSLPLSPHPCEPLLSFPSTHELTVYTALEFSANGRALLVTGERQHSQRNREATETLLEWARNEASKFEGPLGGDMRTPARAFCCSLWRDKVLGVGGPAHLGGALHLWDASSGFLCSSSVSPQSQQQIRCIAPHPRGAPLALTGGISSSRGGVVVLWGYLSVGQMEDADLVAL